MQKMPEGFCDKALVKENYTFDPCKVQILPGLGVIIASEIAT